MKFKSVEEFKTKWPLWKYLLIVGGSYFILCGGFQLLVDWKGYGVSTNKLLISALIWLALSFSFSWFMRYALIKDIKKRAQSIDSKGF